jgi:hypothetical protein
MQGKKILFLFLAFLLPICVFLFLRIFGKNEFAVEPLYQDVMPEVSSNCPPVSLPYRLSKSIVKDFLLPGDSLGLIYFILPAPDKDSQNQLARIKEKFEHYPVSIIDPDSTVIHSQACLFFIKAPYDLVLIDHKGLVRGQYVSDDREDVDRLITEVDIILKRY